MQQPLLGKNSANRQECNNFTATRGYYNNGKWCFQNKNVVMGPDGAQNQEWLCWLRPAATDWTALELSVSWLVRELQ
jgi:hypothetical protein